MKTLLFLFFYLTIGHLHAQTDVAIFYTLRTQDSLLFDVGFNKCDFSQFEILISEDFEFYHDVSGALSSKTAFINSIKNNVCNLPYKPRRQLVETSLKIHPLKKNGELYGAVQTGFHQFYAVKNNGTESLTSTAQFTHLWLLQQGKWMLSRCFSYDHQEPDTVAIDEKLLFKNKAVTEKWLTQKHIPALGIGYIKDGVIAEVSVYGKNENGIPYPANTIFNVASLTKPVTATVVLKLISAGKWDLDEPIYKYWNDPDIANDTRTKVLTTRHILSHQSGFPNWRRSLPGGKLAFQFTPGTAYQYSGEGFEYLRKAIEHKFKKTLAQLAKELIFMPLNMNDTRFYWADEVDETRFAKWYRKDGSQYETYKNTSTNAADDLLTTVEDYSKFMVHIMNGAGLDKDLFQQMISKQVGIKERSYFGLSWVGYEGVNGNKIAIQHGGDDIGVHTIAFIFPESKEGLLIFTNCDNGTDVYIPIVKYYLGDAGQEIIDIETKK